MGRKKAPTASASRMAEARQAAILLKQVSEPTRVLVIMLLAEHEEMHVGALSEHLQQSQPATSHHLALLRHGGLIVPRRVGKNNYYGLTERGEALSGVLKGVLG
ncbi:MAG TPA: metalloregulator ArsR/SmtB family transcription factor [Isosphaeraceae bacterium]|nr:metalloregulator ArsR/SmtB family transcription factor [Isosphaeraceae bacterium]